MYTRKQLQRKTRSQSSSTSERRIFPQRPFNNEANLTKVQPQNDPTPDLQTQLDRAARFGHNFSQVQVHADTPSSVIQPKLSIGAPGDKYEQEADQVATQVMGMAAPVNQLPVQRDMAQPPQEEESLQTKPLAASITPLVQREMAQPSQEEEEPLQTKPSDSFTLQRDMAQPPEEEEEPLQTKPSQQPMAEAGSKNTNLENRLNSSKGGGNPLPNEVRSFMEPRFGADFSQVRVHTDSEAIQMNKDLGAQAFTQGHDIYFGASKSPAISDLTAHELTHVIQQTGAISPAQSH
ncbi:MAG: DUF4157 domain-containing protein [Cyanobacteriota bacterium]